ncbi:hypothetical protein DS745_11900 [Anaerobacillus alkaliphilus]|uniref:Phosphoribulokinase/uridine kinase domain-containing protein n=1 Tax=Anaerobacillus alkaliphilus TaxID=1548597 RepID=A0A4Q0VRL9_9BACI|nr:kinase [Anaerobacillus alkaliphilus]RXJ00230.1 hypothetical protein DS745_11900 [Anaerobacillus alkaliphilus]
MSDITTLLNNIPKLEYGKRFILGIDGLSRSGKTTLVSQLKELVDERGIPTCVFHIDDHIVERKRRYDTGHDEWYEYYQLQWDAEWIKLNFFEKLATAKQLQLPMYDSHTDSHRVEVNEIPDNCLIIVEGVFLQRKEWRGYFDFFVYLDCPRQERFRRENVITQSNIEKFKKRYWKAEDYYLESETPMEKADLIISC